MNLIIIFMCLIIFLISYRYEKNIYNPTSFFSLMWLIIVFLASLRLYDLYEASSLTYLIILIGTFSFLFGSFMTQFFKIKHVKYYAGHTTNGNRTSILNGEPIGLYSVRICAIIVFLIYIPYFVEAIQMISSGLTMQEIKANATSSEFRVSGLNAILYTYIAQPLRFILIPIAILNLTIDKRKDYLLLILTFCIIIFHFVSTGSKISLFYLAVQLVLVIFMFKRKKNLLNRKMKIGIRIISILIVVIVYYYLSQKDKGAGISLYTYISGAIPHLSIKLESFLSHPTYTYGMTSFQGLVRPFINILPSLGLTAGPPELFSTSEQITEYIESTSYIGNGLAYNAFVTMFYYFFVDGHLLGVIIGSLFYGIFCGNAYIKTAINPTRRSIVLYLMIIQLLLTSMVRFQFSNIVYALSFLYYWILLYRLRLYK
ncbi:O-antigen polymerase [Priestia megaterium]